MIKKASKNQPVDKVAARSKGTASFKKPLHAKVPGQRVAADIDPKFKSRKG